MSSVTALLGASWLEHAFRSAESVDDRPDAFALDVAQLASGLTPYCPGASRIGVYAAMGDAGMAQACALWAEALANGPAFANPAAFPWSLASSVAAQVAVALKARGPNITFSGGAHAARAALLTALDHLADGRIDRAVIVAADAGVGPYPRLDPAIVVALLGPLTERGRARLFPIGKPPQSPESAGSSWLTELCLAIELRKRIPMNTDFDGWLRLIEPPFPPASGSSPTVAYGNDCCRTDENHEGKDEP